MTGSASSSTASGGAIEGRKNSSSFPLPVVRLGGLITSLARGLAGGLAGKVRLSDGELGRASEGPHWSLREGKRGGRGRLRLR